ncbi:MAG: hypothetical protein IPP29_16795 [Bacteroidetes bacterium]|nr:hypothetical protein [Bacteroidota bacterium]
MADAGVPNAVEAAIDALKFLICLAGNEISAGKISILSIVTITFWFSIIIYLQQVYMYSYR